MKIVIPDGTRNTIEKGLNALRGYLSGDIKNKGLSVCGIAQTHYLQSLVVVDERKLPPELLEYKASANEKHLTAFDLIGYKFSKLHPCNPPLSLKDQIVYPVGGAIEWRSEYANDLFWFNPRRFQYGNFLLNEMTQLLETGQIDLEGI